MAKDTLPAKDLRGSSREELSAKLDALRRELWQGRTDAANGSLQQPHRLRVLRRQIARIMTVMGEQQHQQTKGKT